LADDASGEYAAPCLSSVVLSPLGGNAVDQTDRRAFHPSGFAVARIPQSRVGVHQAKRVHFRVDALDTFQDVQGDLDGREFLLGIGADKFSRGQIVDRCHKPCPTSHRPEKA
jgi:hypothetical protein